MAETRSCDEQRDDVRGDRRALTAEILKELGLRTRACPDGATRVESSEQYSSRLHFSGGPGPIGDDHVRALHHSGWRSPEGEDLSRRLAADEAQGGSRQSSPTPPHQQQRPSWQSVDLVHYVRAAVGNAVTASDRKPSKGQGMIPSSSCSALDREVAASPYADSGGGGSWRSACGRVNDYRDHRRAFSDGYYRDPGVPRSALPPFQEGYGERAALPPPIEERRPLGIAAPPLPRSVREPRWRQSYNPPSFIDEAAAVMTMPGPPASRDAAYGDRGGGEARWSQLSGELRGSRWPGPGNHNRGAYTDFDREVGHDDRLSHDVPLRHQRPQSPHHRGHQQHNRHGQLTSIFPPEDTAITSPSYDRGGDPVIYSIALRPLLPDVSDSARSASPLPGLAEVVASAEYQAIRGRRRFAFGDLHGDPGRPSDGGGEGAAFPPGGGGSAAGAAAAAAAAAVALGHRERGRQNESMSMETPPTGNKCIEDGCGRRARFAFKGTRKPVYCAKHRLVSGMFDTRHRLCKNEQCPRQPSFGMEGDRRPTYCVKHKKPGMMNVSSRRCTQGGCLRHPNFGFPGNKRALYCKGHRETGMVDVVSRHCRDPACTRRPLYNMRGLRPVSCSDHKLPEMIDVVSTRCQQPGCLRHPSFGYASDKKARRCARHRLENMESVKGPRQKRRREVTTANTASPPVPSSSTASTSSI